MRRWQAAHRTRPMRRYGFALRLGLLAYAVAGIAVGHAVAPASRLLDELDRENDPVR